MIKRINAAGRSHYQIFIGLACFLYMPLGAHAELCYGYITYHPYAGFSDGSDNIAIVCGFEGTNICNVTEGICRSDLQFTPDPPSHEKICYNGFEETGYRCVPHRVYPTVTYYLGVPYCTPTGGSPSCDSGCADWDTETSSSSTAYSWADDGVEECTGG